MAIEFERRFLVHALPDVAYTTKYQIKQAYVCADDTSVVRVRSRHAEHDAFSGQPAKWFMTIKQNRDELGMVNEFEYEISDGSELFQSIAQNIEKSRYEIPHGQLTIEFDVFGGRHAGLMIAEVELTNQEESLWLDENMPEWFGEEITGQHEYSNYYLCTH